MSRWIRGIRITPTAPPGTGWVANPCWAMSRRSSAWACEVAMPVPHSWYQTDARSVMPARTRTNPIRARRRRPRRRRARSATTTSLTAAVYGRQRRPASLLPFPGHAQVEVRAQSLHPAAPEEAQAEPQVVRRADPGDVRVGGGDDRAELRRRPPRDQPGREQRLPVRRPRADRGRFPALHPVEVTAPVFPTRYPQVGMSVLSH